MKNDNKWLSCKVEMLPTEKANFNLYKQTRNIFGEFNKNESLQFSDNETFIGNIHLINSGNAATNDASKYIFYHLCFTSYRNIYEGDYYYDKRLDKIKKATEVKNDRIYYSRLACSHPDDSKKIEATTDSSILIPQVDNSFMLDYVKFKDVHEIKNVMIEVEGKENPDSYPGIPDFIITGIKTTPDNKVIIRKNEQLVTIQALPGSLVVTPEQLKEENWNEIERILSNPDISFGTKMAVLRELYYPPVKKHS